MNLTFISSPYLNFKSFNFIQHNSENYDQTIFITHRLCNFSWIIRTWEYKLYIFILFLKKNRLLHRSAFRYFVWYRPICICMCVCISPSIRLLVLSAMSRWDETDTNVKWPRGSSYSNTSQEKACGWCIRPDYVIKLSHIH